MLAQVVGRTRLQCLAVLHYLLGRVCVVGTGKSLFWCFFTHNGGNCQNIAHIVAIELMHLAGVGVRLFVRGEHVVAFLPVKFRCTQEHTRTHFPAHYIYPLVQLHRQVTVRLDPAGHRLAYYRFGCRADYIWLGQFGFRVGRQGTINHFQAVMCDNRRLFGKAGDMFRLTVKEINRYQQRKVCIQYALGLYTTVHFITHQFPYRPAVWLYRHAAANRRIFRQVGRRYQILVPFAKVFRTRGCDCCFHFFISLSFNSIYLSDTVFCSIAAICFLSIPAKDGGGKIVISTRKPPITII